jgi:hypothetical protein
MATNMPLTWQELETNVFNNNSDFPRIDRDMIIRALSPYGYMGDIHRLHSAISAGVTKKSLHVMLYLHICIIFYFFVKYLTNCHDRASFYTLFQN